MTDEEYKQSSKHEVMILNYAFSDESEEELKKHLDEDDFKSVMQYRKDTEMLNGDVIWWVYDD